ncbi:MAG: flagellar protein FlaF [bacterium]|nr:MAG: flagellar protein FlaF [bacterium]KAF0147226.1 MAG: flagellar protein FlaF [bacterium]KAF0168086.1 MAG: flagellar protein FlaF [bacterium]TXT17592.1 MAG: flagellar protein FlaF [bacterium]
MMAMQMMSQELGDNTSELAGRELEAAVLNKAATLLEEVVGKWQEDADHALLDNALKYNQTLWSVFQAELLNGDNPLPMALRENILTLSSFVDRRSFEVQAYPAPEKLDILIRINRSLAEGLMTH